jgi:glycosyltransferase involved in cell wall biosynthesis
MAPPKNVNRAYVVVTPARNEEAYIQKTIDAMVRQTVLPREWVIVSDGSTDRTDEIVASAAASHPWIQLIRLPQRTAPCFSAVVENTEKGISSLREREYCYVCLLDADVSFQNDYFEILLRRFESEPDLGIAGGIIVDVGVRRYLRRNEVDVAGAVQFFRRECFESLGGLVAIPEGGWDAVTCAVARMNGYKTQTIDELLVDHHKPRNISQGGWLRRTMQMGERDYALGYDPLFEFAKCVRRIFAPPMFIGSVAWWFGYCRAALQRRQRRIPPAVVSHVRSEQRRRLLDMIGFPRPLP